MKQDVPCHRPEDCDPGELSASQTLSIEFVQEAAHRLGLVGLTIAGVGVLVIVLNIVFYDLLGWDAPAHIVPLRVCQGILIAISLFVFWRSRCEVCPRMLLDLGLGYQILGAILIAIPNFWGDGLLQDSMAMLGWLGVWILIFPLIVPARPLKNVLASLACASTGPIIYAIHTVAHGHGLAAAPVLITSFLPYYICAGVAVAPAIVMYRLGKDFSDAQREAKSLGSYQLIEPFGKGGMGEVWRAEHRMLARPAAIKLIKADMLASASSEAERSMVLGRFEREARATAALSSPHTISLFDFGVAQDGTFYYVMELLLGIDLDSLVERFGTVGPARTIHLLVQVCESLAEAHENGLIHRDIKPANIFCCQVGRTRDFVKVLDFGLVRKDRGVQRDRAESLKLTGEDHIVGTPAFMAPEQVEGRVEVDGRADIYALGCVGYWLLTGRYVFDSDSAMRMMIDHVKTSPDPPSKRLGKPLSPELDDVLMACLEKDPAKRPQTAEDLAERLLALDIPKWTQAQARDWWAEHLADLVAGTPQPEDPATARTLTEAHLEYVG